MVQIFKNIKRKGSLQDRVVDKHVLILITSINGDNFGVIG
ncbi:MAG: hypothetical protein RL744_517 [Pseudomonadota bacterium]|jgi:PHD/YefM family antitoxin component YafN of YafNO toxin-antitoxin module